MKKILKMYVRITWKLLYLFFWKYTETIRQKVQMSSITQTEDFCGCNHRIKIPLTVAKFLSIGPQVFCLNEWDFAPSGSHSNEDFPSSTVLFLFFKFFITKYSCISIYNKRTPILFKYFVTSPMPHKWFFFEYSCPIFVHYPGSALLCITVSSVKLKLSKLTPRAGINSLVKSPQRDSVTRFFTSQRYLHIKVHHCC